MCLSLSQLPRSPPSQSGFAVKAVDNDDIEDNDALLLLQRCCRLFGLRVSAFFYLPIIIYVHDLVFKLWRVCIYERRSSLKFN